MNQQAPTADALSAVLGALALPEGGDQADFDDLRDAAWLYRHGLIAVAAQPSGSSEPPKPEPKPETAQSSDRDCNPEVDRTAPPEPPPTPAPEPPATPQPRSLYVDTAQGSPVEDGGARQISVARARYLPNSADLLRALRPLRRRVPDPRRQVIDEEATVAHIADTRQWQCVLKPALRRWLSLQIVFDDAPSMLIWSDTLQEFTLLMQRLGGFRDVHAWYLDASAGALAIQPMDRDARRSWRELRRSDGSSLVLIVSDGIDACWRDGRMAELVQALGQRQSLALINLLPSHWSPRTSIAVDEGARFLKVGSTRRGLPNARLQRHSLRGTRGAGAPGTPLPVLELGGASLSAWAEMLGRRRDANVPAVLLPAAGVQRPASASAAPKAARSDPGVDAEQRVAEFRRHASARAYALTRLFAATVLQLPILRTVQQQLMRETGASELAEFFLSGLIERVSPPEEKQQSQIVFDFLPGVREALLGDALLSERRRVLEVVTDYIGQRIGSPLDFKALVADPEGSHRLLLSRGQQAFAELLPHVLESMGGGYAKQAARLRAPAPPTPEPTPPAEAAPPETSEAAFREAVRGARILWVDDQPKNNAGFVGELSEVGADVHLCLTTKEAVARLTREAKAGSRSPCLMITDLFRKGEKGLGGLKLINDAENIAPWVATIVVSPNARRYEVDAMELGAEGAFTPEQWREAKVAITKALQKCRSPNWLKPVWSEQALHRASVALLKFGRETLGQQAPALTVADENWTVDDVMRAWFIDAVREPLWAQALTVMVGALTRIEPLSVTLDVHKILERNQSTESVTVFGVDRDRMTLLLRPELTTRKQDWLQNLLHKLGQAIREKSKQTAEDRAIERVLASLIPRTPVQRARCGRNLFHHLVNQTGQGPGPLSMRGRLSGLGLLTIARSMAALAPDRPFDVPRLVQVATGRIWGVTLAIDQAPYYHFDWGSKDPLDLLLVAGICAASSVQPLGEVEAREYAAGALRCLLQGMAQFGSGEAEVDVIVAMSTDSHASLFARPRGNALVVTQGERIGDDDVGVGMLLLILSAVGIQPICLNSGLVQHVIKGFDTEAFEMGVFEEIYARRTLLLGNRTLLSPDWPWFSRHIVSDDDAFIRNLALGWSDFAIAYAPRPAVQSLGVNSLRTFVFDLLTRDDLGAVSKSDLNRFSADLVQLLLAVEDMLVREISRPIFAEVVISQASIDEEQYRSLYARLHRRGIQCTLASVDTDDESIAGFDRLLIVNADDGGRGWIALINSIDQVEHSYLHHLLLWYGPVGKREKPILANRPYVLMSVHAYDEDVDELLRELRDRANESTSRTDSDDPQKHKWGRHPTRHRRTLSATVVPSAEPSEADSIFGVLLQVRGRPHWPLEGLVEFHLHPTFGEQVVRVSAITTPDGAGLAELRLRVWGAFTVGALCDDGLTPLELDLATLPDAPASFRER